MESTTASRTALRTMRQRGSVTLGVITIVVGLGLAAWSAVSGQASLVFIGVMLLVAASGWTFLARPALHISRHGVHIHNPFRRTVIPWDKVSDVSGRWNLEVYHGERHVAVWAIASQIERPRGTALLGLGGIGRRLLGGADSSPAPSKGTTVRSAADSVELARLEWGEMLEEGHPGVVAEADVQRQWDWLDIACLVVPIALVVLGILL